MTEKSIDQHREDFEAYLKGRGYASDEYQRSPFSFVSEKYFCHQVEEMWQSYLFAKGVKQ